jgi:hypothetical protein
VRWWALLQPRLPGEHVDAVDVSLLEELLALVELQAEPVLGPGGWDVSWWVGIVVFEGWEGWWERAERAAPGTAQRLRGFDWQRLRLAHESCVTEDGGEWLRGRIAEIAGEHDLRCTICYAAVSRLALSRQRGGPKQMETRRRVTESILDSCG